MTLLVVVMSESRSKQTHTLNYLTNKAPKTKTKRKTITHTIQNKTKQILYVQWDMTALNSIKQ